MLPSRLACKRLRPKFNKSPLDIMMGVIVFVLFQIGKWFRGNYGNCHPTTQNKLFWFYTNQHSGFKCPPSKNPYTASSNPCGLWKGQLHHTFGFFAQKRNLQIWLMGKKRFASKCARKKVYFVKV